MEITLHVNTDTLSQADMLILDAIIQTAKDAPSKPKARKAAAPKVKEAPSEATEEPAGADTPEEDEKAQETPSSPPETTEGPDEALLDKAIARATHLIRKEKRGAEVKEALEKVGVEKVTHLTDDETIQSFLDALPQD